MPLYSYECPECGAIKEAIRNFSQREDPLYCDNDEECMKPVLSVTAKPRRGAGLYSIDTSSSGNWGDYDDG